MIDVSDPVALRLEAERRTRLKAQGARTFDAPDPAPPAPELSPRDANVLEKTEQLEVRNRFIVCGFKVYWLSQARASKQTPGLGDLWIVHTVLPIALWWETKRQVGGEHSTAQEGFAAECTRCQVGYGTGDRYDAQEYLIKIGRAEYSNGAFEPIPFDGHPF